MREIVFFSSALWFASYKIKGKSNFERCADTKPDLPEEYVSILENDTILISYRTFQYLSYTLVMVRLSVDSYEEHPTTASS